MRPRRRRLDSTIESILHRLEQLELHAGTVNETNAAHRAELGTLADELRQSITGIAKDLTRATEGVAQVREAGAALSDRLQSVEGELAALQAQLNPPLGLSTDFGFEVVRPKDDVETIGFTENDTSVDRADRYRAFEDTFRGPETVIRERQQLYLEYVADHTPVLDIGCGRGEFLAALREADIPARGVDLDEGMVRRCMDLGLHAERADGIEFLKAQPDRSFGSIFAAQVIEHLDQHTAERLFDESARVLKPGGVLIAETVNPHALVARKAFWLDRTHHSPVFPEVALALARAAGFQSAHVLFPNASGVLDQDRKTAGDYAVLAYAAN